MAFFNRTLSEITYGFLPQVADFVSLSWDTHISNDREAYAGNFRSMRQEVRATSCRINGNYTRAANVNRWHEDLQGKPRRNLLLACRDTTASPDKR